MTRTIATLLLLLQLRPIAGAAICLHESLADRESCEMTVTTTHQASPAPSSSHVPGPGPAKDCALAQLCTSTTGAVLTIPATTTIATVEHPSAVPSYTNTLLTIDPVAPLVPPPNA